MRTALTWRGLGGVFFAVALLLPAAGTMQAQEWTQTFSLVPGWNAIFLHVQPQNTDPADVFDGVSVRSVWTRGTEPGSVEFISDPADALIGQRGWLAYVPEGRDEAVAPTLADKELVSIEGNRAFLIHLDGAPATLSITGRPLVPNINWEANRYNLVGFPIDPAAAPTFTAYFAASAAHAGQPVYRLLASGVWERVAAPNAAPMRYGEAYWVFSATGSDYIGPLAVDVPTSSGITFGRGVSEQELVFTNLSAAPVTISIQDLASPAAVPLSYRTIVTSGANVGDFEWSPLTGPLSLPATAGGGQVALLGVRRSEFSQPDVASVIGIRNGTGMRWLLQVTALGSPGAAGASAGATTNGPTGSPFAGLWTGVVEIRKVSQPQIGSQVPVSTQGGGNLCAGGLRESMTCSGPTDCPGVCTLMCAGGTMAGMPCTVATQAADCPGSTCNGQPRACAGGINIGLACSPRVCLGGTRAGQACTVATQAQDCPGTDARCQDDCPGSTCASTGACAGGARAGDPCSAATQATDCPGSTCNEGSRCDGGINDALPCDTGADCTFRCDLSGSGSAFPMRILIHVDSNGDARLLKQVIQLWKNGTTKPDPNNPGMMVDDIPGRFLLVTDDTVIPTFCGTPQNPIFCGAALRDGQPVGRRISTAHFDFPGNDLAMQGDFGAPPNILRASILLTPEFPTNPYRHVYHPDHNNIDPEGNPAAEAFEIQREIELAFLSEDPTGLSDADFGFDTVGGVYLEQIRGLHRNAIRVEGVFRLQRTVLAPELNE